jgi:phosphopantothenoylcysteine decarboxylase/phosphopantothenate--cysteine ligase
VRFVEPGEGYLACGWMGAGRLAEPQVIVEAAGRMLQPRGSLSGYRLLVTAGGTVEDLDPVRFIGNRSSGRMGVALAREAQARGAEVILIAARTSVELPHVAEVVRVRSAREMHDAVSARAGAADAVIMAAAVADFTPARGAAAAKIQKSEHGRLTIELEPTTDILAELGRRRGDRPRPILVGFAAQTGEVVEPARRKLLAKRLDLVVANDVLAPGAGFDVETNQVVLVSREATEPLPVMSKAEVAGLVLDRLEDLLAAVPLPAATP